MPHTLLVGLLAALAAALIGSGWQLASRHGVTTTLGPLELAVMRYGIPALVLLPLLLRGDAPWSGITLRTKAMLVFGAGLPFGLLALAGARYAPAAHMGIIMSGSMPLFTALGGWAVRGDAIAGARLAGLVLIAAGMALFGFGSLGDPSASWRGDLLFLLASMLWAAYSLVFARAGVTSWQGAAFVNAWSAILLLPIVLVVGVPRLFTAPWTDVAWQALGQGVVAGMLGLVTYTAAIKRLGAARASLSAALVPVMTALGAAWLLGEPLTGATLLALALIVPGVALASGALWWPLRGVPCIGATDA